MSYPVPGVVQIDTHCIFEFLIQVSSEVWDQMWADPMKHEQWQHAYMNFMFNLFDTSGISTDCPSTFCFW